VKKPSPSFTPLFIILIFSAFLFSGCTTSAPACGWEVPQNGLLNEYTNPELARFYPDPPAVSPQIAERIRTDAEAGNTDAQVQLGMLYLTGRAVQKDPDAAWRWFEKAAQEGNTNAMVMQGSMRWNGSDKKHDPQAAIAFYEKAGEKGNSRALFELGTIYYRGEFKDRKKAGAYFEKAAQNGYTPAMLALGSWYLSREKRDDEQYREKGRQLIMAAAEKGDLVAQYVMGVFSREGMHFEKDEKAARQWYTRAAAQGSPQAKEELNDMDEAGEYSLLPPGQNSPPSKPSMQ